MVKKKSKKPDPEKTEMKSAKNLPFKKFEKPKKKKK